MLAQGLEQPLDCAGPRVDNVLELLLGHGEAELLKDLLCARAGGRRAAQRRRTARRQVARFIVRQLYIFPDTALAAL